MIVSMTGFGDAAMERHGSRFAVEIKSLNNRYFKPTIKLPDGLGGLEPEIEQTLRRRLGRGSITYALKVKLGGEEAVPTVNLDAVRKYLSMIEQLPGAQPDVGRLLFLPGVLEQADETDAASKYADVVHELTAAAIEKLLDMRRREGEALYDDLKKHTDLIATRLADIEERAPGVIEDYHRKLTARVNELLAKAELQVDKQDLLKEVAVFADRSDISEEIARLRHHVETFDTVMKDESHSGRKLDFIAQEMLREANTIGSKANDARIAGDIVEIKGAIDRIKEQVQNVE